MFVMRTVEANVAGVVSNGKLVSGSISVTREQEARLADIAGSRGSCFVKLIPVQLNRDLDF
jgi:hypothetical protein